MAARVHELPAPGVQLGVVIGEGFEEACLALSALGRKGFGIEAPGSAALEEPNRLWSPPLFLEEAELGEPGRALCLGCGSGREAVWLAERGWRVTAVDRLPDALDLGRDLESRFPGDSAIEWVCADLGKDAMPDGPFDLVTKFYFFRADLLGGLAERLALGGRALLETFSPQHRARHGKPSLDSVLDRGLDIPRLTIYLRESVAAGSIFTTRLAASRPCLAARENPCD